MRTAIVCLGLVWTALAWAGEEPLQSMRSTCAAKPTSMAEWTEVLEGLKGDILYMDYARAEQRGQTSLENLSCVTDALSPKTLASFFFLRGLAAARAKQPDKATVAFVQALGLGYSEPWNEDFGEEGRDLYESSHGVAPVYGRLEWTTGLSFSLDGARMGASESTREVLAGWHVVQWRGTSGEQVGMMLHVQADSTLVLDPPVHLKPEKKKWVRILPGTILAATGGVLMAEGYSTGARAVTHQCNATSNEVYVQATEQHRSAKTRAMVGGALLGVGVVGAFVGLLWRPSKRIYVGPQWSRPGARVTVRLGGKP